MNVRMPTEELKIRILHRAEYNNCVARISMRTDGKGRLFWPESKSLQNFCWHERITVTALPGDCRGQFEELTMCQEQLWHELHAFIIIYPFRMCNIVEFWSFRLSPPTNFFKIFVFESEFSVLISRPSSTIPPFHHFHLPLWGSLCRSWDLSPCEVSWRLVRPKMLKMSMESFSHQLSRKKWGRYEFWVLWNTFDTNLGILRHLLWLFKAAETDILPLKINFACKQLRPHGRPIFWIANRFTPMGAKATTVDIFKCQPVEKDAVSSAEAWKASFEATHRYTLNICSNLSITNPFIKMKQQKWLWSWELFVIYVFGSCTLNWPLFVCQFFILSPSNDMKKGSRYSTTHAYNELEIPDPRYSPNEVSFCCRLFIASRIYHQ